MDLIRKWWWVVLVGVVVGLGAVNFNSLILKKCGKTAGGGTRVSNGRDFLFLILISPRSPSCSPAPILLRSC